ncbi:AAA family ATPase [Miltoncostaea oceani]|jgi:SpoVK/Ycf46/Vps4 family AAA+-type ATPase|uniref:AAA family ATPase n=1 Tax=Miltoncostaea oceani TaxID=2843216 RepID=UPI001C3E6910|nr:ATP-binding protein [Miltoncostaea oceani]
MAGRELKALFRAYREGDQLAFRRAAQEIIEEEEAKHHTVLARDLRALLTVGGGSSTVAPEVVLPEPPRDREGEWPLAEVRHAERSLDDLVLTGDLVDRLRLLSEEYRRWDEIDRRGIPRRQRVLFHGPPGCGKTSAAEALATEMGLPLVVVRIDAVVSSYLGETASNLHRIFDFVSQGSWVLLFDEFDALGKARDDPSEHGEIKRVITAFLQMIDAFHGPSLLIAATNHEQLLDSALWRRFDEVLSFPLATVHQSRRLLRQRLRSIKHRDLDIDGSASRLKGKPHSAVEKVAWDAVRFSVLEHRDTVEQNDLDRAVRDALSRPW